MTVSPELHAAVEALKAKHAELTDHVNAVVAAVEAEAARAPTLADVKDLLSKIV